MNLINLIFKDLTTQRVLFHLSDFAFKTLKEYEEDRVGKICWRLNKNLS